MLLELKENKELLNKIVKEYTLATNLAAVGVDIRGVEVSNLHNFTPFCKWMRTSPQYRARCQQCDLFGGLETAKSGNPHIYKCHAGLVDFAVPLIVENQLIGFILSGQVICDEDSQDFPFIYAYQSTWEDNKELIRAYEALPRFTAKKIIASAEMLNIITHHYLKNQIENRIKEQRSISSKSLEVESSPIMHKEIKKAIKYINKNLNRSLTLEEISSHVYLSTHYFSRLFKKEIGTTFVDYVTQKKLELAKDMLKNTTLPIEMIATHLGFSQTSYFCKVFRKKWEISPKDYRNLSY